MSSVVALWWDALLLDPDAFRQVLDSPWTAAVVVVGAGVSQLVGQSVVLFLNHVRPVRFLLAVGLAATTFAAEVAVWATGIWLAALVTPGIDLDADQVLAVVALGHAPFVLSVLLLIPYYGPPIQRVLEIWTLVAVTIGVRAVTDWPAGATVAVIVLGYGFTLLVKVGLDRWVGALDAWLWRTATGQQLRVRVEGAVAAMKERAVADSQRLFHR